AKRSRTPTSLHRHAPNHVGLPATSSCGGSSELSHHPRLLRKTLPREHQSRAWILASCSWFTPRSNNGLRPVLGSRQEPSIDCILFLLHARNQQRIASCSWFAAGSNNGLRPVLGSRREPTTDCILFLVRGRNQLRIASCS